MAVFSWVCKNHEHILKDMQCSQDMYLICTCYSLQCNMLQFNRLG